MNPTDKGRLDVMEQRLNDLIRRVADLERRIAALERAPQPARQVTTQPTAQPARTSTAVEHNYLRRAIASAKKDYDRKYR
ncbi:MAG: hypothetical protein QXG10_04825 [Candidatus Hadarchaeales archaeon]